MSTWANAKVAAMSASHRHTDAGRDLGLAIHARIAISELSCDRIAADEGWREENRSARSFNSAVSEGVHGRDKQSGACGWKVGPNCQAKHLPQPDRTHRSALCCVS
jgi:hypothetical protein